MTFLTSTARWVGGKLHMQPLKLPIMPDEFKTSSTHCSLCFQSQGSTISVLTTQLFLRGRLPCKVCVDLEILESVNDASSG